MELVALGYFMLCSLPIAAWNGLDTNQQVEIINHLADIFFEEYQCTKAEVRLERSETEVRFYFRRMDFKT